MLSKKRGQTTPPPRGFPAERSNQATRSRPSASRARRNSTATKGAIDSSSLFLVRELKGVFTKNDHDADEVFTSWGRETARKYSREELQEALSALAMTEDYGYILRAKGPDWPQGCSTPPLTLSAPFGGTSPTGGGKGHSSKVRSWLPLWRSWHGTAMTDEGGSRWCGGHRPGG